MLLQLQQPTHGWWWSFHHPSRIRTDRGRRRAQTNRPFNLNANANANSNPLPSRTQRIMENISVSGEVGGAGGAYSYNALKRLEEIWGSMCSTEPDAQGPWEVVSTFAGSFSNSNLDKKAAYTFDVVVCGGTLGIFIATALSSRGLRVGIVERNLLKGREQEWNISMKELLELVQVGILLENDIEEFTMVKFNPNRCGFEGKADVWVEDILNLGVSPAKLIDFMKKHFVSRGGIIFEGHSLSSICIYDDAAMRKGRKADGVCLVVGSCSRGFKENITSDVIFSSSSTKMVGDSEVQYFWEAFPSGSGPTDRTTYMFTYVDARSGGPKLEELLDDYWNLMPAYQGVLLDELEILRVVFGIFPTYRDSPLPAGFDRIIQVGDASGIQSPVSFGGFGSMTRHLSRLSTGIYEAVSDDFLDKYSLSLLNPYMPNLSASWLFQRAMSARSSANVSSTFINELLYVNFLSMQKLGDPVLRPFLQDVIQFVPLVKTLGLVMVTQPQILPSIFRQVGVSAILDWSVHFFMLGYYTFLSTFISPVIKPWISILPKKMKYEWKRYLEAWQYGAGLDYTYIQTDTHRE
ncbi:lycopene beta/epsilon cyclase protein isoform X2 [Tasmannia lanceolata]|uniref:lycopene beta/epsilon cyclase protein isoform X2 n=1 Tax=Tasmannia lanceolata TaxID=3420 RepID=UPI004064B227